MIVLSFASNTIFLTSFSVDMWGRCPAAHAAIISQAYELLPEPKEASDQVISALRLQTGMSESQLKHWLSKEKEKQRGGGRR